MSTEPELFTEAPDLPRSGPERGSFVRVRQRRWMVERAEPFDALTALDLACVEDDAQGERLGVIWEAEPDASVIDAARARSGPLRPDPPERFAAYLHALRWGCVTATDPTLFQAPLRAGIIPKSYQLEPLRKALALPRVNLFIADDVGLGKTIEAGLVLHELLLRHRVHRAVIAAPPSVVLQWRDELRQRFGLDFTVYDRAFILDQRRRRGFGVNPWTTRAFFVVSHALLRDEDHLTGLRDWLGDFASGSMLILDEAHVAAPASASRYAVDTQITRAVRDIARRFEHRLFLSATPHNGHSNSFSSLMHILDPQRFTRGIDISGPAQLAPVMVRRLKADVRRFANASLPERKLVEVPLDVAVEDAPELQLAEKLAEYDDALSARAEGADKRARGLVRIAVEGLRKRLLSSVFAFQRTLRQHRKGTASKILGALPSATDDDEATEQQELAQLDLQAAQAAQDVAPLTDDAVRALVDGMASLAEEAADQPDARVRALVDWVRANQCPTLAPLGQRNPDGAPWLPRRVLIFTEFADTRAWLVDQLRAAIEGTDRDDERVGTLHGSQDDDAREAVKQAFNASPEEHPLRILVATDAAREGINLQAACADLFHFDLPWNPARIEQRNGRIDRMLQPAKEVRCHYFRYRNLPEDAVLACLVRKSHAITSELGTFAPVVSDRLLAVLDKGLSRRELQARVGEIEAVGDEAVGEALGAARRELDAAREKDLAASLDLLDKLYEKARESLDCNPERLRQVVSEGLRLSGGEALSPRANPPKTYDVPRMDERNAADPTWRAAIDALRPPRPPKMPEGEWRARCLPRPVRLDPVSTLVSDAVQLHLQHPLAQRAVSPFRSQAFTEDGLSRVTIVVDRSHARKRVLLLGRLAVFGAGAARLHEEVLGLAAYWSEGDDPKRLEPFATASAHDRALEDFYRVLDEPEVPALSDEIVARLLRGAAADQRALEGYLRRRAIARVEVARTQLRKRGAAEAEAMRAVLETQRRSIEAALSGTQLSLGFDDLALDDAQKRQWKDDREFLKRRLPLVEAELATEPDRVRALYEDRQHHVEVVGMVYLWPATS